MVPLELSCYYSLDRQKRQVNINFTYMSYLAKIELTNKGLLIEITNHHTKRGSSFTYVIYLFKGISTLVDYNTEANTNIIARLEFELVYYDVVVQAH